MGWCYVLACTTCRVKIDLAKHGTDEMPDENIGEFVTRHTSCSKREKGKEYYSNLIVCNEQQDEGSEYPDDKFNEYDDG